jgi:hypothetical protein
MDGEYWHVLALRPEQDIWVVSSHEPVGRWMERYRCIGNATVADPKYGTIPVMSFQERTEPPPA